MLVSCCRIFPKPSQQNNKRQTRREKIEKCPDKGLEPTYHFSTFNFQGDSGGPLQCNMEDGRWYLAGITSFGSGCAKAGYPDVFTRLTHYVDWIQETILRNSLLFD